MMEKKNNDIDLEAPNEFLVYKISASEQSELKNDEENKSSELQIRLGFYTEPNTLTLTVVDVYDSDRPGHSKTYLPQNVTTIIPHVLTYSLHILVLPSKKIRFKTNERKGPDPYFDEVFKIPKISLDDTIIWKLRFRLYGTMRNSSHEILGEGYLFLDSLDLSMRTQCKIALMKYGSKESETMRNTVMSSSKCNYKEIIALYKSSQIPEYQGAPKLLMSLSYNFTIGRLTIEVIKGFNFSKRKFNIEPDTLINIAISSKTKEQITTLNTQLLKASSNPLFEENFVLKIHVSRLQEISLKVSGCHQIRGKNSIFGYFDIGYANSTNDERKHWNALLNSKCCDQVVLWHDLMMDKVDSTDRISNEGLITVIDEPKIENCHNEEITLPEETSKNQEEIVENQEEKEEVKDEEFNEGTNDEQVMEYEENVVGIEEADTISDCDLNVTAVVGTGDAERKKTSELRLRLVIDSETHSMLITVVDAYDLARPSSSMNSIREHVTTDVPAVLAYSVHILVLPLKKMRFKTKMRQGPDPYFDEVIKIPKVNHDEAKTWSLRFRLYGSMRTSMKQILGEGFLILESLDLESKTQYKIELMEYDVNIKEHIENRIISASKWKQESLTSLETIDRLTSLIELGSGPELLLGLSYNSNTGRLTMEIIKGSKFPKIKETKLPDTLINVVLISSKGEEMAHSKTVIQRLACEPIFEEKFIFQILLFQLEDVTFKISGCHKKSLGKISAFGYFEMGNSNTTEEEQNHWKDVNTSPCGEQILRWHKFQPIVKK